MATLREQVESLKEVFAEREEEIRQKCNLVERLSKEVEEEKKKREQEERHSQNIIDQKNDRLREISQAVDIYANLKWGIECLHFENLEQLRFAESVSQLRFLKRLQSLTQV